MSKSLESRNYYELLGVEQEATLEEIKAAYKEIARVYHPDSNFFDEILESDTDPEALKTFQTITAAYNILINPEKRANYDALLPKGLKDWDSVDESTPAEPVNTERYAQPMSGTNPKVEGVRQRKPTFGQMSKGYINPFGDMQRAENERISSVSEMLKLNESFWDKIKRILFGSR